MKSARTLGHLCARRNHGQPRAQCSRPSHAPLPWHALCEWERKVPLLFASYFSLALPMRFPTVSHFRRPFHPVTKPSLGLLLVACLTLSAHAALVEAPAAAVDWSAAIANGFSWKNGAALPAGNLVLIGYFKLTDEAIMENSSDLGYLEDNFVEFASARIGDGVGGINGHFSASSTGDTGSSGLDLAGKQMFFWVFGSSDTTSRETIQDTVQAHGIFYIEKSADSNWAFPTQEPVPQTTTIDLSDLTAPTGYTALLPGAHVLVGSFPGGISTETGAPNFGLAAVPEPATALLLLLGGLQAFRRRTDRNPRQVSPNDDAATLHVRR